MISSQDRAAGFYEKLGYQLNPDVDPSVYDKHHKQEERRKEPKRPKNDYLTFHWYFHPYQNC